MDNALELLRNFLQERQGIDPSTVTLDSTLEALNIDSLMLMELFFEFEEKLGMDLGDVKETPKTIGQLIEVVEKLRAAKA